MTALLWVAVLVAGAVGATLRYLTSLAFAGRPRFPWAVLVVNVVGAAVGGLFLALLRHAGLAEEWYTIVVTGFAGGLTTFSTWSVQTLQLAMSDRWREAALSVALNLVVGFGAVAGSYVLTVAIAG